MRNSIIIFLILVSKAALSIPSDINRTGYEQCYSLGEVCIDTDDRVIEGFPVSKDCWEYDEQFQCFSYPQNTD